MMRSISDAPIDAKPALALYTTSGGRFRKAIRVRPAAHPRSLSGRSLVDVQGGGEVRAWGS